MKSKPITFLIGLAILIVLLFATVKSIILYRQGIKPQLNTHTYF